MVGRPGWSFENQDGRPMFASQSSGPMYRKLGDVSRTTGMNSGRSGISVMSPSTASHIDRRGGSP